ncbi:hypothetical protein [Cupriavidus nantongensis]|nr:hypothetical protein [Cupriavidus nantongensis]
MSISTELEAMGSNSEKGQAAPDRAMTVHALMGELSGAVRAATSDGDDSTPRHQRVLLVVSLGAMALAWLTAFFAERDGPLWLAHVCLGLLVVGAATTIAYGLSTSRSFLKEWKTLEVDMLDGAGKRMQLWYETISKLRETYTPDQINFAQDYVCAVSTQVKSSMAYIVGALDKVGLVPLIGSLAVTLAKFFDNGQIPFIWMTAAAVAGIFYVIALRFVGISFTLDRLAVILKHAAKRPVASAQVATDS